MLALAAICVWAAAALPATAKDMQVDCQQTGQDKRRLECDVRFAAHREIGQPTARVVETNRTLPQPVTERYPRPQDRSAILLLFDVSDPARSATINNNIQDARQILRAARPHQEFGIAALPGAGPDSAFESLASVTGDRALVDRRLGDLRAKGLASPIFLSAIEATRRLDETKAPRRALFLFSDCKHEDTGYKLGDVVEEAAKRRVGIYAFGVAERPADTTLLQPCRRMAEETAGRYAEADLQSRRFTPSALEGALSYADSGGWVAVDLPEVLSDQTVELAFPAAGGGQPLLHRVQVMDLGSPTDVRPAAGWFGKSVDWVRSHRLESGLGGFAILLLLLALAAWAVRASRRRSRNRAREHALPSQERTFQIASGGEGPPRGAARRGGAALATLRSVRDDGALHVVTKPMATIGRAKDCDICLSDETVSAHHAMLVHKREGFFEITDMGSRNGVRVNGEKINRQRLSPGDRICFGAAPELRFMPGQDEERAA